MGLPGAFQTQAQLHRLTDKHRTRHTGTENQAADVAIGVQDRQHADRQQQKGQAVSQAVLIIDRHQQHEYQHDRKGHARARRHDKDAPMVKGDARRRGNALCQPALPERFERFDQSTGTSRSNHCTSAPPPCPVGSLRSRSRWPTTEGSTACTSSGIT